MDNLRMMGRVVSPVDDSTVTALYELPSSVNDFLARLSFRYWNVNDLGIMTIQQIIQRTSGVAVVCERIVEAPSGDRMVSSYDISLDLEHADIKRIRTTAMGPLEGIGHVEDIVYKSSKEHIDVKCLQDLFGEAEGDYNKASVSAVQLISQPQRIAEILKIIDFEQEVKPYRVLQTPRQLGYHRPFVSQKKKGVEVDVLLSEPMQPHAFNGDDSNGLHPFLFPHQGLHRQLAEIVGEFDGRAYLAARITLFDGKDGRKIGPVNYMKPVLSSLQ